VFTSEDYGPEFARHLGCRHVMVDRGRSTVPVSGTAVRGDPLNHLDFLEPCVRAYFVRRVVLIGAESTGKTTLAEWLARELNTTWVPEYGREYWEKKVAGLKMDGPLPGWTSEEFLHIAAEQLRREDAAAGIANKVLICDTNAFATGTWHERYVGSRDTGVDAVGARDRVDLYLLCAPDFPFVQDGWRDGESIRDWMHERFLAQLRAGDGRFVLLEGGEADRRARALAEIRQLLARPFDL
jgi:HTH-type transcriptional repressor of NAD biosynthesis genes